MVTKTKTTNSPDTQIMDTRDLGEDFQDFYGQSYDFDQRAHTNGEKPQSDLSVAVSDVEDKIDKANDREAERLNKISDMRRIRELKDKPIQNLSWDDVQDLDNLRKQYPNLNIKKGGVENDESMTSDSTSGLYDRVEEELDILQEMSAEQGIDISEHVQIVKNNLATLMQKLEEISDDDVDKIVSKAIKKYDLQKSKMKARKAPKTIKKSCGRSTCELILQDGISGVGKPGSTLNLYPDNSWSIE